MKKQIEEVLKLVGYKKDEMIIKAENNLEFCRRDAMVVDIANLFNAEDFVKFLDLVMSDEGIGLGIDKEGVLYHKGQRILYVENADLSFNDIEVFCKEESCGVVGKCTYLCVFDIVKYSTDIENVSNGVIISDVNGVVYSDGYGNLIGDISTATLE